MNVYVESNFVLELALQQDQWEICEAILRLCEENRVQLLVPAYCLAEPHETLVRRHKQRRKIKKALNDELGQIARTATNTAQLSGFDRLTDLLISSAEQENSNLNEVAVRLLRTAEVIPMDASVLANAGNYQRRHDFTPQDAIVYASILSHLDRWHRRKSYFFSKDRDFADPNVIDELGSFNGELVPRFDRVHQFINRDPGSTARPD